MPDPGVGNCCLAVERQANRLDRFDGERLLGLDESTVRRQVMQSGCVTDVKSTPKRAEHFESDPQSTVARRTHHHTRSLHECKPITISNLQGFHWVIRRLGFSEGLKKPR
jgi:hypothetical protein